MSTIAKALITIIILAALASAGWWFFLRNPQRSTINDQQSTGSQLPPDDGRFRWGIQTRPFALDRYTDQLMEQQLDLARELGVGWIRLDWHQYVTEQVGGPDDFAWHDKVISMANDRGLHVVLILENVGVSSTDPDVTSKASAAAKKIAEHYKGKIKYYQLLNEVSGSALKGGEYDGTDFARDYNAAKYREIRDLVKGLGQGIKTADPQAKLLVSGQWLHTAMFEQLIKDGVQFDILGWNWFSDMPEDLNQVIIDERTKTSLLTKLKGFGKELWLTELGHRPDKDGQNEPKQADYFKRMAERIYNYGTFKGLFVFELMDQSEVASKGGKPEYYGIVKFAKDSKGNWIIGSKKQAFDAYKQVIAKLSK